MDQHCGDFEIHFPDTEISTEMQSLPRNGQWGGVESIITLCRRLDISILVTLDNADN